MSAQTHPFSSREGFRAYHVVARSAHHAGGRRGSERAAKRSSERRRGARRAPPTHNCDYQPKRGTCTINASAFRFTWLDLGAIGRIAIPTRWLVHVCAATDARTDERRCRCRSGPWSQRPSVGGPVFGLYGRPETRRSVGHLLLRLLRAVDQRVELVQQAARILECRGGLLTVRELGASCGVSSRATSLRRAILRPWECCCSASC